MRVFQSTHSITECDVNIRCIHIDDWYYFNPRTPLQSAMPNWSPSALSASISIHALHYRVRSQDKNFATEIDQFQSTHSITECDPSPHFRAYLPFQISIHALHYRVRCVNFAPRMVNWTISIHALHYRVRYVLLHGVTVWLSNISIHALHYRVRCWHQRSSTSVGLFQSTHSITECDKAPHWVKYIHAIFQSTHSITECDTWWRPTAQPWMISIHALHYRVR